MVKEKVFIIAILAFLTTSGFAQTYDGYTFYAPQNGNKAYLVDMTGATYHSWTYSKTTTYSSYLLPGGTVLRSVNHSGNSFSGGPISGEVQKVDWNGNVLWDYVYSTTDYCSHHDIHPMPNGNALLICYERKTAAQATAAGCSQAIEIWSEKIVEIQPSGTSGGTVVWEWKLWDHLVQHYDATKPNYAVISEHPELMNVNYNTQKDWIHMNGIDYNPTLDQITFSSHNMNEIYVIDHSTTTAQAATHSGGNSGKGGDFLYRWGNPATYGITGTAIINVAHDAHWVPADNPTNPNALAYYNNKGGTGGKTCVDIISPPYNGYNYTLTAGSSFGPSTYAWRHTYSGTTQQNQGNSQQLPNGNTLICLGISGMVYEINPSQVQVWSKTTGQTAQAFRYPPCYVTGTYSASATATPSTIAPGAAAQLNVTPTGGDAYTFSWTSNPVGFTSSLQNPVVNPTVTTIYSVTITNGPCSATATVTVNVSSQPTFTALATPSTMCSGDSTQLNASASAGSGYTYSWTSNPAGFTSTLQNPWVHPSVNTTYSVFMDNGAYNGSANVTVTVTPVPTAVAVATPEQVCAGEPVQLSGSSSGASGTTYFWESVPAGFTSALQNPVVNPVSSAIYILSATGNGCTGRDTAAAEVFPVPSTPLITFLNDTLFSSSATGNQWYLDNSLIPGATGTWYYPELPGTYTVQVTDVNGCESSLSAPYVLVGIGTKDPGTTTVYPNPTTGLLYLKVNLQKNKSFEVRLFNSIGKICFSGTNLPSLDLSSLPTGIYLLSIQAENSVILTQKIVLIK